MKIKNIKTLNEDIEELINNGTYSTMDHKLAASIERENKNKEKATEIIDNKVKEFPIEDRDAHTKVKSTPALKKMMLAESLFEDWVDDDNNLYESINEDWQRKDFPEIISKLNTARAQWVKIQKDFLLNTLKPIVDEWETYPDKQDAEAYPEVTTKNFEEFKATAKGNSKVTTNINQLPWRRFVGVEDFFDPSTMLNRILTGVSYDDNNLYESINEEDIEEGEEDTSWVEDISDALRAYRAGDYKEDIFLKELRELYFKHFSLYPEEMLDESIDGNASHAQTFISALRSAGFGDGFDQKLKIDTYGNGGTRVEFKDQGGTFVVVITDDKVVLEGQDEGDTPFKKEFSTWEEFASEFESLYPGIPVRENKILVEENSLNESSYTRSDDKIMLVKQKREPLIDIIQMELVDGEWGYVKSPDGTITPSKLPHLDYDVKDVGVSFDDSGRYFIRVWDTSEENLQKVIDIAKKFNRDYKIDVDKYVKGDKKWYCLIYLNEDTDFDDPYVDPDAEVNYEGIKGRGTHMRGNPNGRHTRDNEDLEDSQRYPIESPAPAQTGLAMMEDISVNGSLMEDKLSTDMIHNFKPQEGIAEETFNRILEAGKMETFEFTLEDRFPNGVTTEELNKILSEEAQWVYNQLGMKEFIIPDEDDN